jgi:hypothetical protein
MSSNKPTHLPNTKSFKILIKIHPFAASSADFTKTNKKMLNSQPNFKDSNAKPHTMSSIHLPNMVNYIRETGRSAQTWPALEPVLLLREASAHGNPQDRAFPPIRPYSLLHIARLRPDPRPKQHLRPFTNRDRPTRKLLPHQPAASSATIPVPPPPLPPA